MCIRDRRDAAAADGDADDPEARRLALLARRPEEGGTAWLPYNALDALILRCRERGAHATGASDGDGLARAYRKLIAALEGHFEVAIQTERALLVGVGR